ncbi:MAG: hypothetical protein N3D82_04150 [Ignisphaera sp.]|nr:hypothetical protein [Ignisphaera sp.]
MEVKYVYMSIADEALTHCFMVSKDGKRTLGSIAVGRVLRTGVESRNISEGDRVTVFPILGHAPIEIDGACQSVYSIDTKYVLESSQKAFSDLDMLYIAALSINREQLNSVKGVSTLIVGNDLSLLPFMYHSMLYASRLAIIPKYTLWPEIVKGEHVSIYDSSRRFDTIILASSDPLVNDIILKNFREASTIIIHPSISSMLRFDNSLLFNSDKHILSIKFGDIASGIEIYSEFKECISKRVKLTNIDDVPKNIKSPLIVQIS